MFAKVKQRLQDMSTVKRLCEGAEGAVRRAGQELPGAEHYVLSALALDEGSARRVFARLGMDADAYRTALAGLHAEALRKVGIDADGLGQPMPAGGKPAALFDSQPSGQALMRALQEVAKQSAAPLCGAHVLLAAAGMQHSLAGRALRGMGVEPATLVRAAEEELGATFA
jgi:ATP-dependent Clp protease ATP-binding subunit ClpA